MRQPAERLAGSSRRGPSRHNSGPGSATLLPRAHHRESLSTCLLGCAPYPTYGPLSDPVALLLPLRQSTAPHGTRIQFVQRQVRSLDLAYGGYDIWSPLAGESTRIFRFSETP